MRPGSSLSPANLARVCGECEVRPRVLGNTAWPLPCSLTSHQSTLLHSIGGVYVQLSLPLSEGAPVSFPSSTNREQSVGSKRESSEPMHSVGYPQVKICSKIVKAPMYESGSNKCKPTGHTHMCTHRDTHAHTQSLEKKNTTIFLTMYQIILYYISKWLLSKSQFLCNILSGYL